jgi:hypothetical protein
MRTSTANQLHYRTIDGDEKTQDVLIGVTSDSGGIDWFLTTIYL